jgi:hypothetical protein
LCIIGNVLTAATAFTSLALFDLLQQPATNFPQVLTGVIDARVSIARVEEFLLSEEVQGQVRGGGHIGALVYQHTYLYLFCR